MKTKNLGVAVALLAGLSGCPAVVGTSGLITVPPDAGKTCTTHCNTIGMDLGAVAIMANNVGCVCQPRSTQADDSAAVSAGMVTIMLQRQQEQQQQQQSS